LFEHMECLPAHYMNVFTPGIAANDAVGQTALIHASHRLDFTARYCSTQDMDHTELWKHIVRPALDLGDCLLFDCRILHFGLANTSSDTERPLLYTNMTMHWFHDPKNWDDRRPIFENDERDSLYI
jgi:ectoine hydroxylase-related dioxygenase (phytanoyl-CoA dioxygenase family)